jgi:hypothetical protein
MKTTCPKCKTCYDVPEGEILQHIEHHQSFRRKVESLLNSLRALGQSARMTPEERRDRAKLAVTARELKRQKNINVL